MSPQMRIYFLLTNLGESDLCNEEVRENVQYVEHVSIFTIICTVDYDARHTKKSETQHQLSNDINPSPLLYPSQSYQFCPIYL
jgi:hypothetical protein